MSKKSVKLLFSLFDFTGNQSEPYRKAGWTVEQVDIQHGIDFLTYDFEKIIQRVKPDTIGIIAAIPCTDYALSGAKHFARKDRDGSTKQSDKLVKRLKKLIDYCKATGKLLFWVVENPATRIHKLHPWLGNVQQKFNPCDFAGYAPNPKKDRYNKQTWLFGTFHLMRPKFIKPILKDSPIWRNFGGRSLRTKNLRSETPKGFAKAFYIFNH